MKLLKIMSAILYQMNGNDFSRLICYIAETCYMYCYWTTKDTMKKKIKKVIGLAKEITLHELNYLLDFECKPSMFYGLTKIHKSQLINTKCTKIDGEYLE